MLKKLDNIVFSTDDIDLDDIDLDDIDSDILTFLSDGMDLVTTDLKNINPDDVNFDEDDHETIVYVRLMAWRDRYKQNKARKNCGMIRVSITY